MQISSHHFSEYHSPNKIAIITMPRTGSTCLSACIGSVPGIRMEVEPFNHTRHSYHMKPNPSDGMVSEDEIFNRLDKLFDIYLSSAPLPERYRGCHKKKADVAAGFKCMIHQICGMPNEKQFWNLLKVHDIKVIKLYRHNIIKQITSSLISEVTRACVVYAQSSQEKTAKVVIPISELSNMIDVIEDQRSYIDKMVALYGLRNMLVIYEDFENDYTYIERKIMPFLIGRRAVVKVRTKRQNPVSIEDRVVNYNELVRELIRLNRQSFLKDK